MAEPRSCVSVFPALSPPFPLPPLLLPSLLFSFLDRAESTVLAYRVTRCLFQWAVWALAGTKINPLDFELDLARKLTSILAGSGFEIGPAASCVT